MHHKGRRASVAYGEGASDLNTRKQLAVVQPPRSDHPAIGDDTLVLGNYNVITIVGVRLHASCTVQLPDLVQEQNPCGLPLHRRAVLVL